MLQTRLSVTMDRFRNSFRFLTLLTSRHNVQRVQSIEVHAGLNTRDGIHETHQQPTQRMNGTNKDRASSKLHIGISCEHAFKVFNWLDTCPPESLTWHGYHQTDCPKHFWLSGSVSFRREDEFLHQLCYCLILWEVWRNLAVVIYCWILGVRERAVVWFAVSFNWSYRSV